MGENSKIAWTDHTFNPWIGCTKVSAGCEHCYAETLMDHRYQRAKWGPAGTRVVTSETNWRKPLFWNKGAQTVGRRQRVFCASLADVFEDWEGRITNSRGDVCVKPALDSPRSEWDWVAAEIFGPDELGWMLVTMDDLRRELFALVDKTPWLDWLLLTKRPDNVSGMWTPPANGRDPGAVDLLMRHNVWLGTSIESDAHADRWSELVWTGDKVAPVLWVSAEPLLAPLSIPALIYRARRPDWIVFGGESDQGEPARPCNRTWIRDGVRDCRRLGIVPFVKQLGSHSYDSSLFIPPDTRLRDKAGANPVEWPADLGVREFPQSAL